MLRSCLLLTEISGWADGPPPALTLSSVALPPLPPEPPPAARHSAGAACARRRGRELGRAPNVPGVCRCGPWAEGGHSCAATAFSGPILGPFPGNWSFEERRIPPGPCMETLVPLGTGIWVHTREALFLGNHWAPLRAVSAAEAVCSRGNTPQAAVVPQPLGNGPRSAPPPSEAL